MKFIKCSTEVIEQAANELRQYETGEIKPIKTRYDHLNENTYGGILPGTITVIAGTSGTGKSFVAQELEEDFLNPDLNPGAEEHILLRCNWEMIFRSLLVRSIRKQMPLTLKDIYYKEKSEAERQVIEQVIAREQSKNIYYFSQPVTPEEFEKDVRAFLEMHKSAKRIWVTIDHMGLVEGRDKFIAMNTLIAVLNKMKLTQEFSNTSFIPLMQLNREIEGRTDVRFLSPRRGDFYGADSIFQTADLVMVLHRPERLSHEKYMQFHPSKYSHLKEFMDKPGAQRASFLTDNLIFFHYLKLREEDETMNDVHIERLSHKAKTEIEFQQSVKTDQERKVEDTIEKHFAMQGEEAPLPF